MHKTIIALITIAALALAGIMVARQNASEAPQKTQSLSATRCAVSLYQENPAAIGVWKNAFRLAHPEYLVYDVGSACELSDGTTLVSFSHYRGRAGVDPGQTIARFERNKTITRETKGFFCRTIGDHAAPLIMSVSDGRAVIFCSTNDAGQTREEAYELNLDLFSFQKKF